MRFSRAGRTTTPRIWRLQPTPAGSGGRCSIPSWPALLWLWRAEALGALARCAALPVALAWFGASCLWSARPLDAVFAFAQFVLLLAFGMAAGRRLGPLGAAQALGRAALLALGASLAMAVVSPQYAFGQQVNAGALRGIYGEKNHLAMVLSYGFAAMLFEALARPDRRRLMLGAAALLAGVLAARSSIALLQVGLVLGLATAWLGLAGARFGGAATALGAAAGAAMLAAALPAALSALGEDATFNGRTTLWSALWPFVEARPLTGHGFGGFWTGEAAEAVRGELGWNARGAHNGWLTALLLGGAAGLTLWLCHWAQVAGRAASALRPPEGRLGGRRARRPEGRRRSGRS